jgi:hypothetical protein
MHKYFYGNWKAKFPKNLRKGKRPKLGTIAVVGFGPHPCTATTSPAKMESAKA